MPDLERIRCARGEVLMDADSPLDHVFFPDSGVVSAVAVYADGSKDVARGVVPREHGRLKPFTTTIGEAAASPLIRG